MEIVNRNIYEFAFANGSKVIAPKRHWRHALNARLADYRAHLVPDPNGDESESTRVNSSS